jgi:type VI protein secretion system component VasK
MGTTFGLIGAGALVVLIVIVLAMKTAEARGSDKEAKKQLLEARRRHRKFEAKVAEARKQRAELLAAIRERSGLPDDDG